MFLDFGLGRVDTVYVGNANSKRFIDDQQTRGREFVMFGPGTRGGVLGEGVAFGLRKGDTQLEGRLNDALRAAGRDGTISGLCLRWFGIDGSIRYDTSSAVATTTR